MSEPTSIDFYWRPGCIFCMSLERALTADGFALTMRNIWEDAEAASHVRSVANGNETVPTVTIGAISLVNPRADEVESVVRSEAPHLLPTGAG